MKRTKQKAPKKKTGNKHVIYSLVRGKKKTDFEHTNGGHVENGSLILRENATSYHTRFASMLHVETPPASEVETSIKDDSLFLQLREDYEQAVLV